jgi:hypothetical protein
MKSLITNRISTAAALVAFGLAGLGGTLVAVAAPAHADTATITQVDGTSMTGIPHQTAPHGEHEGQGHKGTNEQHDHH